MLRHSILIGLMLILLACSDAPSPPSDPLVRPVKLFHVKDESDSSLRTFPAVVESNQGSFLAFRVSGQLMALPVRAGEEVQEGQLLARLDSEDFELQVEDRKARYELAQSQLQRIENLRQKNIVSESEYDQAKANAQVAEAALRKAQADLQNTELRAPFEGTVAQLFVKNFESVQAKQNILRLENRDQMDVAIQVPERLVARVKKDSGYKPTVVFDGYPELAYDLTIKEWDTTANSQSRTYRVVFTLPVPEEFNLLAGMTGNVSIDLNKITRTPQQHLRVPVESVITSPTSGQQIVWIYDPDTGVVHASNVKVGAMHGDMIAITEGVKAGDVVVAAGAHYLSEGMQVRPYQRERGL